MAVYAVESVDVYSLLKGVSNTGAVTGNAEGTGGAYCTGFSGRNVKLLSNSFSCESSLPGEATGSPRGTGSAGCIAFSMGSGIRRGMGM